MRALDARWGDGMQLSEHTSRRLECSIVKATVPRVFRRKKAKTKKRDQSRALPLWEAPPHSLFPSFSFSFPLLLSFFPSSSSPARPLLSFFPLPQYSDFLQSKMLDPSRTGWLRHVADDLTRLFAAARRDVIHSKFPDAMIFPAWSALADRVLIPS